MSDIFERYDVADVRDLIRDYPLAWLCGADGRADHASQLPLLGEYDDAGRLTHIVGHIPRRNPLFETLSQAPRALILFAGPNGYVSPDQAGVRNWGPTWNYTQLRIEADVTFDPDLTEESLDLLIDAMDDGKPWSRQELGDRYPSMLARIIGFRATVVSAAARFKLGQDEAPATLRSILAKHPDPVLVEWMVRFNKDRL